MYKKIISISTLSILLFCILSPSNAEASYFPSSSDLKYDQVELKTSGEVRLKIDSVGHVGIGTLQPTDNFHVQSDKTPA